MLHGGTSGVGPSTNHRGNHASDEEGKHRARARARAGGGVRGKPGGLELRQSDIGNSGGIHDHGGDASDSARHDQQRGGHRPALPGARRREAVVRLGDQVRGVAASHRCGVDGADESQRHGRLRRRYAVRAARAGYRRRLHHRRQQHGPRRRRVGELDAGSPGKGQGLGSARALLRGHRGEDAEPRVLQPAGGSFLLRRLLQRRAPGDDDGAELSGALRRHRRRCALDVLPGHPVLASLDGQEPDARPRATARPERHEGRRDHQARAREVRCDRRPRRRTDHESARV